MIKTFKIEGLSPILYSTIGPLIMNPVVLRENNNYPFKTGKKHLWYIIKTDDCVTAFMPIEAISINVYKIDNYYATATEGRAKQIKMILQEILSDHPNKIFIATVQKRDENIFISLGFQVDLEWKKYVKLILRR